MVFELLTGERSTFAAVNAEIPNVGAGKPRPLLPDGGRILKTHELRRPRYLRAIYVLRDPRDVILSEQAYQKKLGIFNGRIEEFATNFVCGRVNPYGSWSRHVLSWTASDRHGDDELLVIRYEDLRRDTLTVLTSVAAFLGANTTESELKKVVENNSIESMRREELDAGRVFRNTRDDVRFIRKGRVAGWKDELSGSVADLIQQSFKTEMKRSGYF